MRTIKAILAIGFVLVTACGEAATAQYRTTGATCLSDEVTCHVSSDCCSHWCVNGDCEEREP